MSYERFLKKYTTEHWRDTVIAQRISHVSEQIYVQTMAQIIADSHIHAEDFEFDSDGLNGLSEEVAEECWVAATAFIADVDARCDNQGGIPDGDN